MYRVASLLAVACVTLAATALVSAPNRIIAAEPQKPNRDRNEQLRNRLAVLAAGSITHFHARFSLN
jgi:hypothetical protein